MVLLVSGCAADVGGRVEPIVNGRAGSAADVHGTVAIPIGGVGAPEDLSNCTGTLIRPDVVLTAAHCFFQSDADDAPTNLLEPVDQFEVRAGALSVFEASGDQVYGVTDFVVHPDYDNVDGPADIGPGAHDIALMFTDRPVTQAAVVPLLEPERRADIDLDVTMTITGYGSSRLDGDFPVDTGVLMTGEVQVVDFTDNEVILDSAAGTDTCPGDSGGPVYQFVDGQPRVVGVTSRADPMAVAACGEGGIYTLAHAYEAWIESEVGPPEPMGMDGDDGGCAVQPGSRPTPLALFAVGLGLVVLRRAGRRRAR